MCALVKPGSFFHLGQWAIEGVPIDLNRDDKAEVVEYMRDGSCEAYYAWGWSTPLIDLEFDASAGAFSFTAKVVKFGSSGGGTGICREND